MPRPTPKRNGPIKKLRAWAERSDLDLWFADECHFQQHGSRCVMWVPPEVVDPVLLHAPTRKSVAVFGAVRPQDGHLVVNQASRFNSDSFQSFLQHLLRHRRKGRLQLVVLDNATYHHARALHLWLHAHRALLRLDFLPTCSPKLNHQERVWKLTRQLVTHNRYFPCLDELQQAVLGQFSRWDKPNETLRRLCAII